jgi:hypothetical protein
VGSIAVEYLRDAAQAAVTEDVILDGGEMGAHEALVVLGFAVDFQAGIDPGSE